MPKQRLAVTVVAWQALPAILPQSGKNIGGLETGAWRLAKNLATLESVDPTIIVRSPVASTQVIEGVRVALYGQRREYTRRNVSDCIDFGDGFRLKRFSPKLLWQVPYLAATWPWRTKDPAPMQPDPRLLSHSPDVWIALGASRESAGVIATAASQGKPSILMVQSNADLDPRFIKEPQWKTPYGEIGAHCAFALESASLVICQTRVQQDLLHKHFGRDSVLIPNATDPQPWREAIQKPGDYVLWTGRYDQFHKRPKLAIEIARQCPDIPFRMIINASDERVRRDIHASLPPNVSVIDYVPFQQLPEVFGSARVFLSTGSAKYEGFPTVLLHAIAAEKPIVSLEDFDGFITKSRSGTVCDDDPTLAAHTIARLWNQETPYDPAAAVAYLRQHHAADVITKQWAEILRDLSGTADGFQDE